MKTVITKAELVLAGILLTLISLNIYSESYEALVLDPPEGYTTSTFQAINNKGQILGSYSVFDNTLKTATKSDVFLWDKGVVTMLGTLSGYGITYPQDLNENGIAIGSYNSTADLGKDAGGDDTEDSRGIVWDLNNQNAMVSIGTINNSSNLQYSVEVGGISNTNIIAGKSDDPRDDMFNGYTYNYSGDKIVTSISTLLATNAYFSSYGDYGYSMCFTINNNNEAVGLSLDYNGSYGWTFPPIIYDSVNGIKPLPHDLAKSTEWYAMAIGDGGHIAGIYIDKSISGNTAGDEPRIKPVFWLNKNTNPIDIPLPERYPYARPVHINISGQVVGYMYGENDSARNNGFHAFIYDTQNGLRDLNTLISGQFNFNMTHALHINDKGEVVGRYMALNSQDQSYYSRAILLKPVVNTQPLTPPNLTRVSVVSVIRGNNNETNSDVIASTQNIH